MLSACFQEQDFDIFSVTSSTWFPEITVPNFFLLVPGISSFETRRNSQGLVMISDMLEEGDWGISLQIILLYCERKIIFPQLLYLKCVCVCVCVYFMWILPILKPASSVLQTQRIFSFFFWKVSETNTVKDI